MLSLSLSLSLPLPVLFSLSFSRSSPLHALFEPQLSVVPSPPHPAVVLGSTPLPDSSLLPSPPTHQPIIISPLLLFSPLPSLPDQSLSPSPSPSHLILRLETIHPLCSTRLCSSSADHLYHLDHLITPIAFHPHISPTISTQTRSPPPTLHPGQSRHPLSSRPFTTHTHTHATPGFFFPFQCRAQYRPIDKAETLIA